MMKQTDRKALGSVVLGTMTLLGTTVSPAVALATTTPATTDATATTAATDVKVSNDVQVANVSGGFAYDQATITSNKDIKAYFSRIDNFLCGAQGTAIESQPIDTWMITVSGDVQSEFTESLGDLADADALSVVMGCTCGTNPANGRGSINAKVTGVSIWDIYKQAGVKSDANTITFVSSDGYSVALPLTYVMQRDSLIVYNINGAPLEDSVGGTNQLWLGSTSARYFARDIVSVEFTNEDEIPPAPGTAEAREAYANTPNAAVTAGEVS